MELFHYLVPVFTNRNPRNVYKNNITYIHAIWKKSDDCSCLYQDYKV